MKVMTTNIGRYTLLILTHANCGDGGKLLLQGTLGSSAGCSHGGGDAHVQGHGGGG